jgi:flagellar biosynthesis protein FlhF
MITIDTYRIAAVEQLKVYGEIMHLPVDVVITPEQLEQAIARHSDKELILIDTAGRSPRDSYCIDELASFLAPELHIDKHLVLSAGTRENELLDTIERFSTLEINNTIFTKIDECSSLGILLNTQIQNSSPLSYVTNGQRVPEDLLEISPKLVAELIMSQHEGSIHD